MTKPHLEINYRGGKPASAYLTLPRRKSDRAERTIPHGPLLVDYSIDGRPIGIEIEAISPSVVSLLQKLFVELGIKGIDAAELAPLAA